MEHLLTKKNLTVLNSFALVETLYAFDLDRSINESIWKTLAQLNEVAPIAIKTSRTLLPFKPKILVSSIVDAGGMSAELLRLLKEKKYRFGVFLGDHQADDDVFKIRVPELMTIRVGESHRTQAKYFLQNAEEIPKFLAYLLEYNHYSG